MIVRLLAIVMAVTPFLCGCGLTQPYPNRTTFAIEPGPAARISTAQRTTVCLQSLRIAKPYDSTLFVYKTGPSTFVQDYYAGFIAAPDKLLAAATVQWLNDSSAVAYAITPGSTMAYSCVLEVNITALYGDFSVAGKPRAVIELRAFLITEDPAIPRVLLQRQYQEAEPIAATDPKHLVDGWNSCYRRILTQLATDVAHAASTAN